MLHVIEFILSKPRCSHARLPHIHSRRILHVCNILPRCLDSFSFLKLKAFKYLLFLLFYELYPLHVWQVQPSAKVAEKEAHKWATTHRSKGRNDERVCRRTQSKITTETPPILQHSHFALLFAYNTHTYVCMYICM